MNWQEILSFALIDYEGYKLTVFGLIKMIAVIIGGVVLSRITQRSIMRIAQMKRTFDARAAYSFGRILHYAIMTLAIILSLSVAGFDFTKLAIVAGALSVGIGFGLQGIANNFISGIIMLFERNINVGDVVELQSGIFGTIKEINVRSTLINTPDNMDVLVPNSEFLSGQVTNWTLREGMVRFRIPFGVAYGTDKDRMREVILNSANALPMTVNEEPDYGTRVFMTGFGDSSLDFVLAAWVSDDAAKRPATTKSDYLWTIESTLKRNDIEIPFPQRDLHVKSDFRKKDEDEKPMLRS